MRASEVGARLGGVYGASHAAREPDPTFARCALALALAATRHGDRERVLAGHLALELGKRQGHIEIEPAGRARRTVRLGDGGKRSAVLIKEIHQDRPIAKLA